MVFLPIERFILVSFIFVAMIASPQAQASGLNRVTTQSQSQVTTQFQVKMPARAYQQSQVASQFQSVTWAEGELIPVTGRPNPYQLSEEELSAAIRRGRLHTLNWPVEVTGSLIPKAPTRLLLPSLQVELGLQEYPKTEGVGPFFIPFLNGKRPSHRMGFTEMESAGTVGVTFSCAACHVGTLFGRQVFGLTNRFPGANEVFHRGIRWSKKITPEVFENVLGGNRKDREMYARTRENLASVEARVPVAKGLDTSLAHVALSLSRRAQDLDASKTISDSLNPREERLRTVMADSKPGNWWSVKYKNRYLLDGSVVSGNPIFTNLIWNEIGRGTDLIDLKNWLAQNDQIIKDITTAIFNSEPPHITDFFSANKIDLARAQAGEELFNNRCAKCHGTYIKNWSLDNAGEMSPAVRLKTFQVRYFEQTPVKDVGTDGFRAQGMASLTQLNDLRISRENGILIREQAGYVPPPLVGIWARFPYFHNNSIPNLCELLLPAEKRIKRFYTGVVEDKKSDFDFSCNGYPTRGKTPLSWRTQEHRFDTSRPGLSNSGHDRGFSEFTQEDRKNLIQFLQTL